MDPQNILLGIVSFVNFFWGLIIFIQGRKKISSILFSIFTFSIVLWTFAMISYRASETDTLNWCRFLYVAAILIPLAFLYFNYFFPEGKKRLSGRFYFALSLPAVVLIFLTIFSNYIIADAFRVPGEENRIVFGTLYFFYTLYISGYFGWSFFLLFISQKKYLGMIRAQLRYMLTGALLSSLIAMLTNLILPWFGYFNLNWVGQAITPVWISFTFYAIIRYRLMDIKFILSRGVIYILSFVLIIGFAFLATIMTAEFLPHLPTQVSRVLILIVSIFSFQYIFRFFEKLASKYFYYPFYSSQRVLTDL
ncbi:MAG: histidine kinase N-terminal 7TM domain-containing protein, partial [Candidatus Pacebacteria bacterium]|nr:histidine kinase N-terminal 7TM domain-containing protein [Candidatus Paceibacterota bacterium]